MSKTCQQCRFFVSIADGAKGICKRNPPSTEQVAFNPTLSYEWCGEFQAEQPEQPTTGESVDCVQCGIIYPPHFANGACRVCGRGLIASGSKPRNNTPEFIIALAVEIGFKAHEKGLSLQQAIESVR